MTLRPEVISGILSAIERIAKNTRISFVLTALTGFFVFDLFGLVETLGISKAVDAYRFWLALVFGFSTLNLAVGVAYSLFLGAVWSGAHLVKIAAVARQARKARSLARKLSFQSKLVVLHMAKFAPHSLRLRTEHVAIQELRRNGIVAEAPGPALVGFDPYRLTDTGEHVVKMLGSLVGEPMDQDWAWELLQECLEPAHSPFIRPLS